MAEYTSLEDYKEYRQPASNTLLYMLKEVKNAGDISGDMHISLIPDKCPEFDGGYVLFELIDSNTSVTIKFVLDLENSGDDILGRIVFDSDINGRDFGIYGRYHWTAQGVVFRTRTLRVAADGTITPFYEGGYYTTPNTDGAADIHFNAGYGLLRVDSLFNYTPEQSSLIFKYYSQRLYILTKPSESGVDLGNIRYGLVTGSYYNYISYLRDEDVMDHLIEGVSEEDDDTTKYPYRKYYFYNKTYNINGTLLRNKSGEYIGSGRLTGYITNSGPYNIKLIKRGELKGRYDDETEYVEVTSLPNLTSNDTIDIYYGLLDTNIPIFKNIIDAGDYLLTGNTDGAINAADLEEDSKTGKDGTVARFDRANTYTMIPRGQLVYDVTSNINDIYTWMRSLNQINITQLMFMYWWNNNPIECLTSLYWTPLDVDELTRASAPAPVIFGGYAAGMDPEHPLDESSWIKDPVLQYQGKEMLLGQFQFSRKYNDWRDYECFSYSLYLPFYGIVELEPHFIVGKRLEVKYIYYPTNHTIHYMIFVKKNIYKEFDCSVGIDLAMTSADAAGKSQEVFSDIFSMGGSAVSEAGSLASGNVTGAISSASSLISSGIDLFKKPKVVTWGNVNPTSNIGDPLQALLFIEEQKCVVPNKLHEMYGYATYYIGKVSGVSGYCEFSDVRLESSATPEEKNQIISMMQQGVII